MAAQDSARPETPAVEARAFPEELRDRVKRHGKFAPHEVKYVEGKTNAFLFEGWAAFYRGRCIAHASTDEEVRSLVYAMTEGGHS